MSLISALAMPAMAQNAMSLLPQDQPASRPSGIWTIFQPVAPKPESQPEPVQEATEVDEPAEVAPTKYKLVKVPLPPVIDRKAGKTDSKRTEPPKTTAKTATSAEKPDSTQQAETDIAPSPPPAPRPTGVFAMLAAYSAPEGATATVDSGDIVRPTLDLPATTRVSPAPAPKPTSAKLTKLDLSDPFKPKKAPSAAGEKDDDLEDEEGTKLVEKQVDSVQIACLKPNLLALIYKAGDHFGATPVITSGFRSRGRRGSYHRRCEAADFFVPDVSSAKLVAFLKTLPGAGGVGTYCHTKSVHIDTGEPRNWHQCGFRRSFALRTPVTEIGSR